MLGKLLLANACISIPDFGPIYLYTLYTLFGSICTRRLDPPTRLGGIETERLRRSTDFLLPDRQTKQHRHENTHTHRHTDKMQKMQKMVEDLQLADKLKDLKSTVQKQIKGKEKEVAIGAAVAALVLGGAVYYTRKARKSKKKADNDQGKSDHGHSQGDDDGGCKAEQEENCEKGCCGSGPPPSAFDTVPLDKLLGTVLRQRPDKTFEKVSASSLAGPGKVVGLYFSASWCPPCHHFTPELIAFYNKVRAVNKEKFEVVFISLDREEEAWKNYYASMPWHAMSFDDDDGKKRLCEKYAVNSIPTLILVDGQGKLKDLSGNLYVHLGAEASEFPWDNYEEKLKAKMKAVQEENERKFQEEEAAARKMPKTVKDARHPHTLNMMETVYDGSYACDGCREHGQGHAYHCNDCGFDLHPRCAKEEEESGVVEESPVVSPVVSPSKPQPSEDDIAKALDELIESKYVTASRVASSKKKGESSEKVKYKCSECPKAFLAPEFAIKHIKGKHPKVVDGLRAEAKKAAAAALAH
eukprot:g75979.t1